MFTIQKCQTFLALQWIHRLRLTSSKEVKPRKEEPLQVKLTSAPLPSPQQAQMQD